MGTVSDRCRWEKSVTIWHVKRRWGSNWWLKSKLADWERILGPVSWRPTTVKWRQFSQSIRHSTIGTPQTEYHEALPWSVKDEVRCDCTFADDGNASWYLFCWVPMVEWRLDCRHLTVVGLHDTGPWWPVQKHFVCKFGGGGGGWTPKRDSGGSG